MIVTVKKDPINLRVIQGWSLQHYGIRNSSWLYIQQLDSQYSYEETISTLPNIDQNQDKSCDDKQSSYDNEYSQKQENYQFIKSSFISKLCKYTGQNVQSNHKYLDQQLEQALKAIRAGQLQQLAKIVKLQPSMPQANIDQFMSTKSQYVLNQLGQCGRNALHWAIQNSDIDIVSYLLIKSCDPNTCTMDDYTPLQLAVQCHSIDIINLLLQQHKIDVNKVTNNGTALHLAIRNRHIKVVQLLLNHNADIQIEDKNGIKPEHLAKEDWQVMHLIQKTKTIRQNYQIPTIVKGQLFKMGKFRSKPVTMIINPFKNQIVIQNNKTAESTTLLQITNWTKIKQKTLMMNSSLQYFQIVMKNEIKWVLGLKNKEFIDQWFKQINKCRNYCIMQCHKYCKSSKQDYIIKLIDDNKKKISHHRINANKTTTDMRNSISILNLSYEKVKENTEQHGKLQAIQASNETQSIIKPLEQGDVSKILLGSANEINNFKKMSSEKTTDVYQPIKINDNYKQSNRKTVIVPYEMQEIQVVYSHFRILKLIGKGAFGLIFLALHRKTDKIYALKVLNKKRLNQKKNLKYAIGETNILKKVDFRFIIKLYYSFQTPTNLYMALQYCPNGDLGELIAQKQTVSENCARFIIAQIILAIQYLHNCGIIYRDLKPENILISKNGYIRLTDFGLSKERKFSESFCGSPAYLSPQMLQKKGVGFANDYYGIGCILYEMLVGQPPYFDDNLDKLFQNIKSAKLRFPSNVSTKAKSLINLLLQRESTKRLGVNSISQIKEDDFFKILNWKALMNENLPVPMELVNKQDENILDLYVIDPKLNFNDQDYMPNESQVSKINNYTFCRQSEKQQIS